MQDFHQSWIYDSLTSDRAGQAPKLVFMLTPNKACEPALQLAAVDPARLTCHTILQANKVPAKQQNK
jgi:hypothetical protein